MQGYGEALYWVPQALLTAVLCLAAVQQDGRALGSVPKALQAQVKEAAESPKPSGRSSGTRKEDEKSIRK
ncbi:hypothetical protein FACS1894200_12700 [Spirochaetia bacterium]|nr:hypothetical protein FACS1894200_12700 [Spirochaetia bacterium]